MRSPDSIRWATTCKSGNNPVQLEPNNRFNSFYLLNTVTPPGPKETTGINHPRGEFTTWDTTEHLIITLITLIISKNDSFDSAESCRLDLTSTALDPPIAWPYVRCIEIRNSRKPDQTAVPNVARVKSENETFCALPRQDASGFVIHEIFVLSGQKNGLPWIICSSWRDDASLHNDLDMLATVRDVDEGFIYRPRWWALIQGQQLAWNPTTSSLKLSQCHLSSPSSPCTQPCGLSLLFVSLGLPFCLLLRHLHGILSSYPLATIRSIHFSRH